MKAIGFKTSLPVQESESFVEFSRDMPVSSDQQLLIKIEAISVNPGL